MKLRIEPIEVGGYGHIYNRGNRKMNIFYDVSDKWHFLKILRYFNDQNSSAHLFRKISKEPGFDPGHPFSFQWPKEWPQQSPLVKILSYCLRNNHIHLFLKEIREGGISFFMKKSNNGFTGYSNLKYNETGHIFQGSYKRKRVDTEQFVDYLDVYIQVFNAMEEYPGGIEKAIKEFDKAFDAVFENPFSSLGESFGKRNLEIIDRDFLTERFPTIESYKEFAREAILLRGIKEKLKRLVLE
jgi:putative transposase